MVGIAQTAVVSTTGARGREKWDRGAGWWGDLDLRTTTPLPFHGVRALRTLAVEAGWFQIVHHGLPCVPLYLRNEFLIMLKN